MKKLVSTILALALVISFAPAATLSFAAGTPSGWAVGEMNEANLEGLLTPNAQKDFQRVLTRTEFCELVVALIERTLGSELPLPATNPFTDTSNIDVQKASLYGGSSPVVEGVGGGLFSPNNNVSREQIVTMMIRALDRLSIDTERALLPAQPAASLPFKDNSNISAWAADSLKKAYANNIIKGNDLGNFNPRAHIKSEECVAIVRRSNSTSQEILNAGLSPTQLAEKTERDINIGFAYGDTEQGVSQNILLPTSGAGGAAISWQSSNPDVIAISGSTGIVKTAGMTAQTTLIATINASGVTRTKQFVLHTTPYAGDERIMQNALQALELEYLNSGDTADSVTGRVFLPDSSLGARVTWSSSAPSVVNASTGAVTLPSDSSTVTLTATVSYNSLTRTKAFTLTVVNPNNLKAVSLHGVELGMSLSQVQSVLGQPKYTGSVSSTETWYIFHTNYANFIAVGLLSNRVAAIYSMSSNWTSQLKNRATGAVITPEQADVLTGVGAKAYTDSTVSGSSRYAVLVYDRTTNIASTRVLTADAEEQLIFHLINAFRYLNSRSALIWNAKLGSSAREHSTEMGSGNYFSETGRNGSTFVTRAQAKGYESALVSFGAVAAGGANAFDFLNDYINNSGKRSQLMSTALTVVGVGFGSGYSGSNSTLSTAVFGTLIGITGITTTPASVSVNANGTATTVTLNVTPTNRNETFTVASSNNAYATVTNTAAAPTTLTITGHAQGTVNITVTGNSSGSVYTIPVNVGTVYASSLTIRNEANAYVANNTSTTIANAGNYILGAGNTYQFNATTYPSTSGSTSAVAWSSSDTRIATVSAAGLVTGVNSGTAQITARVQRSATASDYFTVTFYFTVVSMTFSPSAASNNYSLTMTQGSMTITPNIIASSLPTGSNLSSYSASSSNSAASVGTGNMSVIAVTAGTTTGVATITVTANITNSANYNYTVKVSGRFTVSVTGQVEYPTSATTSPSSLEVFAGEAKTITINTTPTTVARKEVSHNYTGSDITISYDSNKNVVVTGGNVTSKTTVSFEIYVLKKATVSSETPLQAICPVTVTVNPITYTLEITTPASGSVTVNQGGTTDITAKITPSYGLVVPANLDVQWTFSGDITLSSQSGPSVTVTAGSSSPVTAYVSAQIIDKLTSALIGTKSTVTIEVITPTS